MGGSAWSDKTYRARSSSFAASGADPFVYTSKMASARGDDRKCHPDMDPKGIKSSPFAKRESRDSAAHPESNAIAVFFDETGSMGTIPRVLQSKLGKLMSVLLTKGVIPHPQILFGAIGDAQGCSEVAPAQVGQFESGNEMDESLSKLYLEGAGGGQTWESYDLALYTAARKTVIDCFEKRDRKGYLFLIGDEDIRDQVSAVEVKHYFDDDLQADIPIADILAEAQAMYHVFMLRVPYNDGNNPSNSRIDAHWKSLLGERVLDLKNTDAVSETIAMAIAVTEGALLKDAAADLAAAGLDSGAIHAASNALARYVGPGPVAKAAANTSLPQAVGAPSKGTRL